MSKRQDLISWLSVYDRALAMEKTMPLPNRATIEKYEAKWRETAFALARLEMVAHQKRLYGTTERSEIETAQEFIK